MQVLEFLKTTKDINLTTLAFKMWPKHKSANTYLSVKLSGARPWTAKDEAKAAEILKELGIKLTSLSAKP